MPSPSFEYLISASDAYPTRAGSQFAASCCAARRTLGQQTLAAAAVGTGAAQVYLSPSDFTFAATSQSFASPRLNWMPPSETSVLPLAAPSRLHHQGHCSRRRKLSG